MKKTNFWNNLYAEFQDKVLDQDKGFYSVGPYPELNTDAIFDFFKEKIEQQPLTARELMLIGALETLSAQADNYTELVEQATNDEDPAYFQEWKLAVAQADERLKELKNRFPQNF